MINQYDSDTQWGQGAKGHLWGMNWQSLFGDQVNIINHFKQVVSSYKLAIIFQGVYPVEILI